MATKPPSLARGCVVLGIAYAARYGVPSVLAALPRLALFAAGSAVDEAEIPARFLRQAGLGFFHTVAANYVLEAITAGLAALILVMTIRRVARGAEEGAPFGREIATSIRAPLVQTAIRSSWVVFALLGALYVLLHVSGTVVASGGPLQILLLPLFLILTPLGMGGPFGLLVGVLGFGALTVMLGMLALYAVRNTLMHSGAEAAAEIPVFRSALDRPFGMVRLVLNLAWLYGIPFMLLYAWVPTLIFPRTNMPSFSDVAASGGGAPEGSPMLMELARGLYDGGVVGAGLILTGLAALVIWNKAAEVALAREPNVTPQTVTRNRPWHDPETPMARARRGQPATFGRRAR
jgi:hypothetical protein